MINVALGFRQKIGHWLNERRESVTVQGFKGKLSSVSTMLICADVDTDEQRDALNLLKSQMKNLCPSAKLTIVCCHQKSSGEDNFISGDGTLYVSEDDLSFWFKFRNKSLAEILASEYDMAIILPEQNDIILNFIADYVHSGLRVGRDNCGTADYLNFKIADNSNIKSFIPKLLKNLQMVFS